MSRVLLQQNTFRRYYAWADHYLWAVICRSRGGLSANWKEEKKASNDKILLFNLAKPQLKNPSHTYQHHAEITQSLTFSALIRLSTTMHNHSEISSINSGKLSLLANNNLWSFSHTRLMQVKGCRVTRWFRTGKKTWPGSTFTWKFALTKFIRLLRACSLSQWLSGHLRKANNIAPFCLSPDQGHGPAQPNRTRI